MGFFGQLLGGGLIRAGERFHEEADRQHELEKWQRSKELELLSDHIAKNWDNMTADQQMSTLDMVAPKFGKKGKDLYPMVTAMKAVHTMIPQIQAVPEALGPVQRGGTVTAAPSTEAPVRGISAPATPQFSDLPQPGATLSPAIMAASTGHEAVLPMAAGERVPSLRSNERVVQQTPNQILAQRKAAQAEAERQQKMSDQIAEIMGSTMDPADKELAIKALHIPPAVLAAQERQTGAPSVGLSTTEYVSPDGKTTITGQATRTGHVMLTSGSIVDPVTKRTILPGELVSPAALATWTKRHAYSPWIGIGQDSSPVVVNREEIARRGLGSIAGTVPDVKVAENKTPLIDLNTGKVAGEWGARSGLGGMTGNGTPPATPNTPNAKPPLELGRAARPTTEQNARNYLDSSLRSLNKVLEISKRRPDLIGQWDYTKAVGKRMVGMQKDKDANDLINSLKRFTEDAIRIKEGAVIPEAMYSRLEGIVSAKGWSSEVQFADDLNNAIETLNIARKQRGMGPLQPEVTQGAPQVNAPPPPPKSAQQGSSDSGQRREQRNKTTGQYRYSLDGGATWQPGRLPQ